MGPSSASSRNEAGPVRLEPLELWIERQPGPLRPQVLAALRQHGEPLRWAITAVGSPPLRDLMQPEPRIPIQPVLWTPRRRPTRLGTQGLLEAP
jgi:hypothetical protein